MENDIPNFDQFIGYIIDHPSKAGVISSKSGFLDPHLEFFWQKCDMCKVNYDVIGKVETSQEDINYVSHKVNNKFNDKSLTKQQWNFVPKLD